MADWAQVVLVVGPAAVTGLTGYFIAHQQNRSAHKRLELQLNDAREREERQRKRDVRSAPLLALRKEVATMAETLGSFFSAGDLSVTAIGKSSEHLNPVRQAIYERALEYCQNGTFDQAILQLTDADIVSKAREIHVEYMALSYKVVPEPDSYNDILAALPGIRAKIIQLQQLINQHLEAQ